MSVSSTRESRWVKMAPYLLTAAVAATALMWLQGVPAAQQVKTKRYEITARRLDADMASGLVTCEGGPKLISKDLRLECQRLTAQFDEKFEELVTAEAEGPVEFEFATLQEGVKRTVKGSAQSAWVDSAKREMRLEGNTDLRVSDPKSPEAHLTANKVTLSMDLRGRFLVAEGAPKAVWGDGTVSGDRLEDVFPPTDERPANAEITGNAR